MKKLSVILPSYNEAERIESTLRELNTYLQKQSYESEIIVVNDGSKDKTSEVVKHISQEIKNLVFLDNSENHGKGWVVKQGMLKATGDIRVFMDADNSTKINEIEKFIPYFNEGYDWVIGSRRISGSVIAVHQPWFRDFLGGVFRTIVHTLVPIHVTDSQCGFKACTAEAANSIFPKQTIFRWAFDVEILALVRKSKQKIKEAPVTWVNDSQSHVKLSGMINMLLEVLTIRWNLWTGKYH